MDFQNKYIHIIASFICYIANIVPLILEYIKDNTTTECIYETCI